MKVAKISQRWPLTFPSMLSTTNTDQGQRAGRAKCSTCLTRQGRSNGEGVWSETGSLKDE